MFQEEENELDPSELGTKEYWVSIYETEKRNFQVHQDPGEVWFGEQSELRIVKWLIDNKIPESSKIIDLGCGNGMMLVELGKSGFANLTGVDYCEGAVELSESVVKAHGLKEIQFKVVDLTEEMDFGEFDIAVDKGTYDAICLNPKDSMLKRRKYIDNLAKMLNENGYFIITSCNWTSSELVNQFAVLFESVKVLPTPMFQFGGNSGTIFTTLVLKKKQIGI